MYTPAFELAINHVMMYEVGGFWDLDADGVVDGTNLHGCGYTNDPSDRGNETKFGISATANPDLDIYNLDWDGALRVYYKRYWLAGDCQHMPAKLAILHFDGCVNHGVGRASKFVQDAVGATPDGDIGPLTLRLIAEQDEIAICNAICDQREVFYKSIVENNESQHIYLKGWLRRICEIRSFVLESCNS